MKTLICTLNSKYIHSTLAPWCLFTACKAYCRNGVDLSVYEGTINENQDTLAERLIAENADICTFSCYIWNIKKVLALCEKIKKAIPEAYIILGGPEVAYCQRDILEKHSFVDFVLSGEGEIVLPALLDCLCEKSSPKDLDGVSFRKGNEFIIKNEAIGEVFDYPSPYCEEYLISLKGRIAYIESSRGCPFSCAYCLSGRCGKVKFRSLEQTKKEILTLASSGAKTVKFIDRTFNCNNERAIEILSFIRENRGKSIPDNICFHFEISADILKESFVNEVAKAHKGALQFEIGIQSLNSETLSAIGRKSDKAKLFSNIKSLVDLGNCHIHTDLIAGLPTETYESFVEGFNECFTLKANMLQLGFLKLLHGSALRQNADTFPCRFSSEAPYEVVSTPTLSEEELHRLHIAEKEVDRLYNSGRFPKTLSYVLDSGRLMPFDLFYHIGKNIKEESLPLDRYTDRLFEVLSSLEGIKEDTLRDCLVYDRLSCNNSGIIPKSLYHHDERLRKIKHILSLEFPLSKGTNRSVAILYTEKKVIFSDYLTKDVITGRYNIKELPFDFFGETFFDFHIDK